jgi:hypothetical protein
MQMRIKHAPPLVMALVLIGTTASALSQAPRDDAHRDGSWKLVLLPFGEDEFAIVKLIEKDGKTTASVADAHEMLGRPAVKAVEWKDGALTVALSGAGGDTVFKGTFVKNGPSAGKVLGTVNFRGTVYPARMETTTDSKVSPIKQSPLIAKLAETQQESSPKSKTKKLEEAIQGNHGSPNSSLLYAELLSSAQAAGLELAKVEDIVKRWTQEAKPYGDAWSNEVRHKALKAVASSKSFAKLTVELAQEVEKTVSESDAETKANVVGILARAARNAGMEEMAKVSEARYLKLDQQLDEEYHKKVPPFKPTPYLGRTDKIADQVVLMELFTGAQCPPCVAADVAFDALLTSYKPTELIGLQYHLHIPGPDPLTNSDSLARQEYYGSGVRGTPSTFFNGHSEAGGGGPMGNSQRKYTEYREIIDKILDSSSGAKITVSANQAGDQIKILASAQVTSNGSDQKSNSATTKPNGHEGEKSAEEKDKRKAVLRLALTEESIHYVGGNKLRYHHHVVRALPGGAKGTDLKDGAGKIEVTFNLAELKRDLEEYLSDFAKTATFHNPPPEMKFDNLAVVAFVQDDGDKTILNAVSVPVTTSRP